MATFSLSPIEELNENGPGPDHQERDEPARPRRLTPPTLDALVIVRFEDREDADEPYSPSAASSIGTRRLTPSMLSQEIERKFMGEDRWARNIMDQSPLRTDLNGVKRVIFGTDPDPISRGFLLRNPLLATYVLTGILFPELEIRRRRRRDLGFYNGFYGPLWWA